MERVMGIEPTTFSLGSREGCDVSETSKEDTTSSDSACTSACAGASGVRRDGGEISWLVEFVARLSKKERAVLRRLLEEGAR